MGRRDRKPLTPHIEIIAPRISRDRGASERAVLLAYSAVRERWPERGRPCEADTPRC